MDIHEYQAKEMLKRFGVSTPRGGIAYSPEQAVYRCSELSGDKWVVKAQIHSGARGKAGGVRICATEEEVADAAQWMLGRRLAAIKYTAIEFAARGQLGVKQGTPEEAALDTSKL